MTTDEIISTARNKVLETTDEIISNATVLQHVNQAYIEVYKRVFTTNQVASATVVCSNGTCSLPADYGRMYTRAYDQDGREFTEISIADYHDDQRLGYFYTIEDGSLLVSETDVTSLTVRYYAKPETLTTGSTPTIDEYFHEVVMYGAVWRMHEDLQDEELATYYQKKFEDELTRRLSSQSNYEESNQKGGEMFQYQKLI